MHDRLAKENVALASFKDSNEAYERRGRVNSLRETINDLTKLSEPK